MNLELEQYELNRFFNYYMSLANCRVPWAQTWVADALFWGWGVPRDYDGFIYWDTKAARNGSKTSMRRMLLYYHSIGSYESAATLSAAKAVSSMDRAIDFFFSTKEEYLKQFSGKMVSQVIDEFAEAIDVPEKFRGEDWVHELRDDKVPLLRAICKIYKFGEEPDWNAAAKILESIELPKEENPVWSIEDDSIHYALCLKERGLEISQSFYDQIFKKTSYGRGFGSESNLSAQKVRHAIRFALEGETDYAAFLGRAMMEEENKRGNKGRRLVYHDDQAAMVYLQMAAERFPDSLATFDAISLVSDRRKKTFNYNYAKQLCFKVENDLDRMKAGEGDNEPKRSGLVVKCINPYYRLARAYVDLAKGVMDDNERFFLGNRGMAALEKNEQQGGKQDLFTLGELYFHAFHDYRSALNRFAQCEFTEEVQRYVKQCRMKGAQI